jgi:hypothetical protein
MFSTKFTCSQMSVATFFGKLDSGGKIGRSSLYVGETEHFTSRLQVLRTSLIYHTYTSTTK